MTSLFLIPRSFPSGLWQSFHDAVAASDYVVLRLITCKSTFFSYRFMINFCTKKWTFVISYSKAITLLTTSCLTSSPQTPTDTLSSKKQNHCIHPILPLLRYRFSSGIWGVVLASLSHTSCLHPNTNTYHGTQNTTAIRIQVTGISSVQYIEPPFFVQCKTNWEIGCQKVEITILS